MIDAQPGVAAKGVPKILPERVDPLIGVERAQRVCPALRDETAIGVAPAALGRLYSVSSIQTGA